MVESPGSLVLATVRAVRRPWACPGGDLAGGVQIDIDLRQIKSLLLAGRVAGADVQAAQGRTRTLNQDAAIDRQGRHRVRHRRPGVKRCSRR